jgi:broad specificity phosphatase PhoE
MMPVRITYFVHGTTTDNERGIGTGWLPGELSKLGTQQARDLGPMVESQHFDILFCSDLKRAVDSARLGFGDKYKIVPDGRLRECNYGDLNGKPTSEWESRAKDYIDTPFPNGESYRDVERRVAGFITMLKRDYNEKNVAIVAHQAPQLALDVLLRGRTWEQAIDEDWRKRKAWQPGWPYEA